MNKLQEQKLKRLLRPIIENILTEITKKQVSQLKKGDIVWYWYKGLRTGSVEVEFVEFKPSTGKNVYDTAIVKTDQPSLNPDKNGLIIVRISYLYTEDPEMESTSGSKKGFLNKGVHGSRKWE